MITTYRKAWTITLKKGHILNDVDVLTHAYSQVGGASDNLQRSDGIATDQAETNDEHIILRFYQHRVNDLRQLFAKFIYDSTASTTVTGNNNTSSSDEVIKLYVPSECENSLLPSISDLCHDYCVNGVLSDWYGKIGAPNESTTARANECLARLRELIYFRPMP